jgi:hypothetical protein
LIKKGGITNGAACNKGSQVHHQHNVAAQHFALDRRSAWGCFAIKVYRKSLGTGDGTRNGTGESRKINNEGKRGGDCEMTEDKDFFKEMEEVKEILEDIRQRFAPFSGAVPHDDISDEEISNALETFDWGMNLLSNPTLPNGDLGYWKDELLVDLQYLARYIYIALSNLHDQFARYQNRIIDHAMTLTDEINNWSYWMKRLGDKEEKEEIKQ